MSTAFATRKTDMDARARAGVSRDIIIIFKKVKNTSPGNSRHHKDSIIHISFLSNFSSFFLY